MTDEFDNQIETIPPTQPDHNGDEGSPESENAIACNSGGPSPFLFEVEAPDFKGKTLEELDGITPASFITGAAGTGKTTLIRSALQSDPNYGKVCSTTGISAINIGGITINSALGYSTVEVLRDNYIAGYLQPKLREIRDEGYRWLICDEASMLSYKALNFIMLGLRQLNENSPDVQPLGLMLVADFGQLPPIGEVLYREGKPVIERGREKKEPTPWVFESEEWDQFEANMIKLTKVHRQSNPQFLAAINAIRRGQGNVGAGMLKTSGVEFRKVLDVNFDGTTLMAKNDEVDRLNKLRLQQLPGKVIALPNERWCARSVEPGEWKNIPSTLELKIGAYVMVLTNDPPDFNYVNGDCGYVMDKQTRLGENGPEEVIIVKLLRNNKEVAIPKIIRRIEQKAEPEPEEQAKDSRVRREQLGRRSRWILGEIEFWPLRLAYATTIDKSQGLSLDLVQIDPRAQFFGSPNRAYVAVSRARTPEGLIIVGDPRTLAEKVKSDVRCKKWL